MMMLDDLKKNLDLEKNELFQAPIPYSTPVSAAHSPF